MRCFIFLSIIACFNNLYSQSIVSNLDSLNYYFNVGIVLHPAGQENKILTTLPSWEAQIELPKQKLSIRYQQSYSIFKPIVITGINGDKSYGNWDMLHNTDFTMTYNWKREKKKVALLSIGHFWADLGYSDFSLQNNYTNKTDRAIKIAAAYPISNFFAELSVYTFYNDSFDPAATIRFFYRFKI